MMAATRSKIRETGEPLEDRIKEPSNLLRELQKRKQKSKNDIIEPARPGRALEQMTSVDDVVDELPFVDVQPLPVVARGQTKQNNDVPNKVIVEKLLETPKLSVEPGFKNRAPLQKDERAKDLIQEALRNPICITTEDLLHVSEPMRQELKKLLIKRRLEKKSVSLAAEVEPGENVDPSGQNDVIETIRVERLPEATFEVLTEDRDGMDKGSIVVSDPVVQYLNTLSPGEEPKTVIVGGESHSLRTLYPLINRTGEVEALLDAGSQIVSMSKTIAVALEVNWDPDITVRMESANKTYENTLGLARNVPFLFGTITAYLQVHVVQNAAYKVLLGRPFDVVTESEVKNSRDGSQSVTLTDPNTGERCVMHTHERGKVPSVLQRHFKSDFQVPSMN
jgi:hypothetical protein